MPISNLKFVKNHFIIKNILYLGFINFGISKNSTNLVPVNLEIKAITNSHYIIDYESKTPF